MISDIIVVKKHVILDLLHHNERDVCPYEADWSRYFGIDKKSEERGDIVTSEQMLPFELCLSQVRTEQQITVASDAYSMNPNMFG